MIIQKHQRKILETVVGMSQKKEQKKGQIGLEVEQVSEAVVSGYCSTTMMAHRTGETVGKEVGKAPLMEMIMMMKGIDYTIGMGCCLESLVGLEEVEETGNQRPTSMTVPVIANIEESEKEELAIGFSI